MDLSTQYLGMTLKNPLVVSASFLTESLDNFRKLEDAGVGAIVKHSLFEEQIIQDIIDLEKKLQQGTESFAEALSYFPKPDEFLLDPSGYLDHITRAKKAVDIPVIASLNGYSIGGWVKYAQKIQEAGADALELNIYSIPSDLDSSGEKVEETFLEILKLTKESVTIPVAVKLNPFFSSIPNMAKKLDDAGADGLVLFNRFYQPDIDLETMEVKPNIQLSTPADMRLPLRWIAILHKRVKASLAATSGIHHPQDVVKMLLAGADVTMLCSTLLKNGIDYVPTILKKVEEWMKEHGYESIDQLRGSMSHDSCEDPSLYERANYMKVLQSWKS